MAGKMKLSAKLKALIRQNSLETFREAPRDIGKGVAKSLAHDVIGGGSTDMRAQILGLKEHSHEKPKAGEKPKKSEGVKTGEEVTLFDAKEHHGEKKKATADIAAGIDHRSDILHGSERKRRAETQQLGGKYEQIITELKRIAASSKILQEKVKHIVTEQAPVDIGEYHVNFAEWLLLTLQQARQQIEDSGSWMAALQSKKKSKQYGSMAKKHGTGFTLSNERTAATQTG